MDLRAVRLLLGVVVFGVATTTDAQTTPQRAAPPGPLESRAVPVTPENPIPRRVASELPKYPTEESGTKRVGTVTLRITIDETGRVAEWRQPFLPDRSSWQRMVDGKSMLVMGAPLDPPFVKAAMDVVSRWRYEPPARAPLSLYVKIGFAPGADGELLWHDARPPDPAPAAATSQTSSTGVQGGVPGGVVGGVLGGVPGGVAPSPPTAPPPGGPVRVGGNIKAPRKIKDVRPVYPPVAQAARVQGIVIIEAIIDTSGRVSEAKVVRSVEMLDQAALDAVRQWEFEATLLNGQPVAIIMSVTVNFVLDNKPPAPPSAAPTPVPQN